MDMKTWLLGAIARLRFRLFGWKHIPVLEVLETSEAEVFKDAMETVDLDASLTHIEETAPEVEPRDREKFFRELRGWA
jgi:hypothetical protein